MAVFPQFEVLDTFGPVEALNQMTRGGYEWAGKLSLAILAETLDPVSAMPSGSLIDQKILPTHTFAEPPEIDVLLIPGGPGTEIPEVAKPVTDFVQRVYPSLHSLITVCTGAGIAARAGVLNGHKATTNKNYWVGPADSPVSAVLETDSHIGRNNPVWTTHLLDCTCTMGAVRKYMDHIWCQRRYRWHARMG